MSNTTIKTFVAVVAAASVACSSASAAPPRATGAVPTAHLSPARVLPPGVHVKRIRTAQSMRATAHTAAVTWGGTLASQQCVNGGIFAYPPTQLYASPDALAYWRLEVFKSTSSGWQPVATSAWARGMATSKGLTHYGTSQVGGYSLSGWFWFTGSTFGDAVSAFSPVALGPGVYLALNHIQIGGVDWADYAQFSSGSYYCYQ
jgi:hypothetical protein